MDDEYFKSNQGNKNQLQNINNTAFFKNINLLRRNKQLDTIYGLHKNVDGEWYFANNKLKFNKNVIHINNIKQKMSPGLFQLLFHAKPLHYNKNDLKTYKNILIATNAHKRNYKPDSQIKGTKSFKYQYIIKKLFIPKLYIGGNGLSMKSFSSSKPNYIYWDDPNELVDRLRLLLSSESAGHNNHKNEIISIVDELKEAKIIK